MDSAAFFAVPGNNGYEFASECPGVQCFPASRPSILVIRDCRCGTGPSGGSSIERSPTGKVKEKGIPIYPALDCKFKGPRAGRSKNTDFSQEFGQAPLVVYFWQVCTR